MNDFEKFGDIYAKDTELRTGVNTLRNNVISQTIKPLTITKNGTYSADPRVDAYGYSPVTVDVQEEPWAPLEDGYSNFWFELDNDTLSPWLNFSAKNNDAVIDWGDGSGEVALDTLTPTHTYAKAGKYVVKVKGVTGIAQQIVSPIDTNYMYVLKHIEFNNEVTALADYAFQYTGIKEIIFPSTITTNGSSVMRACPYLVKATINTLNTANSLPVFAYCLNLRDISINSGHTTLSNNFAFNCVCLETVTIPSTITSIGNNAFNSCICLQEIHIQATTPPTLGPTVFSNLPSNYVIYVPVGTLSAYQTAWSDYADHIVEEGQSLSKAQLRAIEEEQKKSDNGEERR